MKKTPSELENKNKEIARKIIELKKEIKAEIIFKPKGSKVETLREIIEKSSRELNTERKIKMKEM